MKWTNRVITGLVILLLTLLVLLLLSTLYYSTDKKMELGSLTDWISSLSTAATLVVACMAYKKAPEWMAQKHYDIVSKVIEEAIYVDLRKLSSLSYQYKNQIVHTGLILKNALSKKEGLPPNIEENLEKLEKLLMEFFNLSYSIQNRLKAIPRYNYVITPYALNVMDEIKKTADIYNNLQTQIEFAAHEVNSLVYADEQAINLTKAEITDLQRESIELNKKLSDYIKSVYAENKTIAEFIAIRNK